MASSSIFSTFCSVSVLLLLGALISPGSKWGNMVMAIEDEDFALLPFGSDSAIDNFIRLPQCGGPPQTHTRDKTAKMTVKNNCLRTIWPAVLTTGPGQHQLSTTGFELAPGDSWSFNVPTPWTGRVWARTRCSNNGGFFTCSTGECGRGLECNGAGGVPPTTLAEFTLAATNDGQDFYDISLVDGFNIPASISSEGGTGPCKSSNCRADVNRVCPTELQEKSGDEVIGCKSACFVFNQPRYCCIGEFDGPDKCKPTNYSQVFKNQCPDAYSYAYDDRSSTFTCSNRANYVITFCG